MLNFEGLKRLVKTPVFLAELEKAFFEAMNAGYAGNSQKRSIRWLPGSKIIEHNRAPWRIMDTYLVTKLGPRGGGTTIIAYEETPVWMMHYLGQYEKEAIPCLKAALCAAYAEKKFFGGRGPEEFVHDGLVYRNDVDRAYRCDFQHSNFFKGYETIRRQVREPDGAPGKALGWHSYQGMMMF